MLLLLAAAVLRLVGLGEAPLASAEARSAFAVWQFGQPGRLAGDIISPAYFAFTTLIRPFLGDQDWVMRLVPALFGLATVALPWLLRKHLGSIGAAAAALFLAISPLNVAISRTAGGDAIAIFAIVLLVVAWLRTRVDFQPAWAIVAGVALGLGFASAPVFYSGLLTLTIAWLLLRLLGPAFVVNAVELDRATNGRNLTQIALVALVTFVGVSSLFLWVPAGLGGSADIAADWLMQFGFSGGISSLIAPLLLMVRYEPLLALLGIVGIVWAVWGNRPLSSLLSYWLLAGLVLVLFQNGIASNALVLTAAGYLLLGRLTNQIFAKPPNRWTWIMLAITLLMGALLITNLTRFLRTSIYNPADYTNLFIILIGIVVGSVAVYYVWAMDGSAVVPGAWLGLLLLLLAYQWGTAWQLSHGPALDVREAWIGSTADDELATFNQTLQNISRSVSNSDADIDILSTADNPVLRWYLRDFHAATFATTLPPNANTSLIITPIENNEPQLGADYLGSDFGILQNDEFLTPVNTSSIVDTLRWWFFHETTVPIAEERIILWVRADLAQP